MGRRLNTPTPTVIQTELAPFDESFYIEARDVTEQWYYDNTNQFKPNRTVTPLILVPHVSVCDVDTKEKYSPDFYNVRWFEKKYNLTTGLYEETEITNQTESSTAEYVKEGHTLKVKKNVPYTYPITIRCSADYRDPRDVGITYNTGDSVVLVTNRDANIEYPRLDVKCPTSQSYNPLTDDGVNNSYQHGSEFTLRALADFDAVTSQSGKPYRADPLGTEEIVPQNDSDGVVTVAPTIDIRYGDVEQYDQTFMRRQTGGGGLSAIDGNKAYLQKVKGNSVAWNQLQTNSTQLSNWRKGNSVTELTIDDGVLHAKLSGTSQGNCFAYYTYNINKPNFVEGHKLFVSSLVKQVGSSGKTNVNFAVLQGNVTQIISEISEYNVWVESKSIIVSNGVSNEIGINCDWTTITDVYFKDYYVIDLTLMFGAGNEPTTVEAFEAWLAANVGQLDYYPYNAGELVNVKMTGIKTTGFNQWDEQWELGTINWNTGINANSNTIIRSKNYIPVIENKEYYLKINCNCNLFFYNDKKEIISQLFISWGSTFTTPAGCRYIRFSPYAAYGTTYNNDICINISNPSKNGTYEAYWSKTAPFDPRKVYGKLNGAGSMVQIAADGLRSAGVITVEGQTVLVRDIISVGTSEVFIKVGTRAYQSGDESDASVKTDGTTTFYPLSTELHYTDCMYSEDGGQTFIPLDRAINYEWYGISNNTEVKADTLPWYRSGQNTDTLVVDAMYGEDIRVVLRAKDEVGNLIPPKAYRSIHWRIPDVDSAVVSENGGAVRSNTIEMTFDTTINVNGAVLTEAQKQEHLRLNWKIRPNDSAQETDKGWGQKKTIPATELRHSRGVNNSLASTIVQPYVYLLGAYEQVTEEGVVVTENGEPVFDRPL